MNYTSQQIATLRQKVKDYGLNGQDIIADYNDEELCNMVNGIGAEWMPDWCVALTNGLHPSLEAAAMIHDIEYSHGGDDKRRAEADRRFLENCRLCAKKEYAWWDIRRYLAQHSGNKFYKLLRCFGSWAWNSGEPLAEGIDD